MSERSLLKELIEIYEKQRKEEKDGIVELFVRRRDFTILVSLSENVKEEAKEKTKKVLKFFGFEPLKEDIYGKIYLLLSKLEEELTYLKCLLTHVCNLDVLSHEAIDVVAKRREDENDK
jgi:hypothetical protein